MKYALSHKFIRGEHELVVGHEVSATNHASRGVAEVLFRTSTVNGRDWTPIVLGARAPLGVVKYVLRLKRDEDLQKLLMELDEVVMQAWRDEKLALEGEGGAGSAQLPHGLRAQP